MDPRRVSRLGFFAVLSTAVLISAAALGQPAAAQSGASAARSLAVGPITVGLPAGWTWRVERGRYRQCTNPIVRLWLASYRLPAWWGKHEGWLVVSRGQVLIAVDVSPRRSKSTPWKHWQIRQSQLKPVRTVGGNRYRAEVNFQPNKAVTGSAWLGSLSMPRAMVRTANQLLRSLRVDQKYGCD
jgi:hypothetical protein